MGNVFSRFTMTILLLVTSIVVFAYDAEVDGIYYNLDKSNKTAEVTFSSTSYNSYSGNVKIPKTIFVDETYNVTKISNQAFFCSWGLLSVEIPNSIISIGVQAFQGCSSLTSINIPESVTNIEEYAFDNGYVTSYSVDSQNTVFDSRGNCNAIIDTNSNMLRFGCKNTIIPSTVTSIGARGFENCTELTEITIPESVNYIGYYGFQGCSSLMSITCYATNVPSLSYSIFEYVPQNTATLYVPSGCVDMYKEASQWNSFGTITEVSPYASYKAYGTCGDNLTWTLDGQGTLSISGSGNMYDYPAYYGIDEAQNPWKDHLSDIKTLVINEGVTSIGSYTFQYLDNLESISFANTLLDIKECAFRDCKSLKSIEIPSSVAHIGKWNFDTCPSVESIDVDSRNTCYWGNSYYNAIFRTKDNCLIVGCKNTIIPEGITAIDTCAFYGCTGLTSIHIPSSVKLIRVAFACCSNLNSVTFDEGIETIGVEAFYQCTALESIVLPNSVKTIDWGAFNGCTKLEMIDIPESVTTIRNGTFYTLQGTPWYEKYKNDSKNVYNNVVYINNVAYDVIDYEAKQFSFKENTVSISDYFISRRGTIDEVVIPSNVFFIGTFAFPSTLNKVTCLATIPPTCERFAFGDENGSDAILYVPKGTLEAYKNAYYWKDFQEIREISSTLSLTDDAPDLASGTYAAGSVTYTRTTTPGKFATFCLPFDVDLSTMSDYITQTYTFAPWCTHTKLLGMLKLMVNKVENTQTISAGTPFIAKMKSDNVVFTNSTEVTYSETTPNPEPTTLLVYDNDGISSVLTQNTDLTVKIGGTYTKMTDLDSDKYRAFTTSGGFGPTTWLNPFRAYVYKDDSSSSSAKISSIVIDLDDSEDEATGISDVASQLSTAPQTYYNLNGQRMNSTNLSKGLYITNGKKYIKK